MWGKSRHEPPLLTLPKAPIFANDATPEPVIEPTRDEATHATPGLVAGAARASSPSASGVRPPTTPRARRGPPSSRPGPPGRLGPYRGGNCRASAAAWWSITRRMVACIVYTRLTAVSASRPCSPYRARTAWHVASRTCGDCRSSRPPRLMSASSAVRPPSGPGVSTAWSAASRVPTPPPGPGPAVVGGGRPRRGAARPLRRRRGQRGGGAQVVDEGGEQRPGLPGVREVAARRGQTVARLEEVAHGGARRLGTRLGIGRHRPSRQRFAPASGLMQDRRRPPCGTTSPTGAGRVPRPPGEVR
jgi:hypothetical protein